MPKRRTSALTVVRSVSAPRAPNITVRVPRAPSGGTRKKRHHRRRGGGSTISTKKMALSMALGGAAVGIIEKQFPTFPTLPMVGRTGTIALAAYFFGGQKAGIARDICLGACVLAGYEFAKDGKISGDDD